MAGKLLLLIEKVVFVPVSLENDARDNGKVDERFSLTWEKKHRKKKISFSPSELHNDLSTLFEIVLEFISQKQQTMATAELLILLSVAIMKFS